MVARIRLEGHEAIAKSLNAKPAQIKRAARRTVRLAVTSLHKELGGAIPRTAGTPVAAYRRVRAKKRNAKTRGGRVSGSVWMGTRKIAAAYVGKLRNDPSAGGAWAGKYFFENAFVAKMKSGQESIFERVEGSNKIKQRYVNLPQARGVAKRAAFNTRKELASQFSKNLALEMAKKK